jgi:hypothetical protein
MSTNDTNCERSTIMSSTVPSARELSKEIELRTSTTIGPWKLSADDAQWAQAGKWSHAVAIGIIGAWFMAIAALTGGPVNAATSEQARAAEATVYVPDAMEPVFYGAVAGLPPGF